MTSPRLKSFNYAIGMFGTSIPINMLKIYAAPGPQPEQASRFLLTIFPPILMIISFTFSFFINFEKVGYTPAVARVE